jgi:hypothetical protein
VPGFTLAPGDVRRSIENPIKAFEYMIELFSVQEFLACSSVSVPELERAWSKKKGVPTYQVKEQLDRLLGSLLIEKRNAPSLRAL